MASGCWRWTFRLYLLAVWVSAVGMFGVQAWWLVRLVLDADESPMGQYPFECLALIVICIPLLPMGFAIIMFYVVLREGAITGEVISDSELCAEMGYLFYGWYFGFDAICNFVAFIVLGIRLHFKLRSADIDSPLCQDYIDIDPTCATTRRVVQSTMGVFVVVGVAFLAYYIRNQVRDEREYRRKEAAKRDAEHGLLPEIEDGTRPRRQAQETGQLDAWVEDDLPTYTQARTTHQPKPEAIQSMGISLAHNSEVSHGSASRHVGNNTKSPKASMKGAIAQGSAGRPTGAVVHRGSEDSDRRNAKRQGATMAIRPSAYRQDTASAESALIDAPSRLARDTAARTAYREQGSQLRYPPSAHATSRKHDAFRTNQRF
ncbi:hypothetical protein PUNSTDRAFT_144180 [Punctularia strigosozonata HHB-11173 SS5]|uniref:uncharacterized protein n=1 Tax=Punctularia strigosozonata (strain HHB-11173) TaxID=741275 RepID=UPI000441768A|nr:uncharacterized protein PUNSTDRAFT_144180 [Punctularia strigosozonata HHB-11173 SS5]EIN07560.1 hypothetical protein PUNSTDRAFT_144180 [Punctularia strigosozonata HHB-11173 SS5]